MDEATAPCLPAGALQNSALASLLIAPSRGAALTLAPETVVALHPLAVAGLGGLLANALALLPLGRTDGGRCALACYGRTLGAAACGLGTILVGFGGLFSGDDLLLLHLIFTFGLQRDVENPCRDEVTDAAGRRPVYAAALLVAGLCLAPSPLAQTASTAASSVLPGFPSL